MEYLYRYEPTLQYCKGVRKGKNQFSVQMTEKSLTDISTVTVNASVVLG